MGEIVPFRGRDPEPDVSEDGGWISGEVVCPVCDERWWASAPVGTADMECDVCGAHRATWVRPVEREGEFWRCACGSDVFRLHREGFCCVACAVMQRF